LIGIKYTFRQFKKINFGGGRRPNLGVTPEKLDREIRRKLLYS